MCIRDSVDTDVITSITLNSKRRLTPSSPGKVTFYIKDRTYRVTNIVMPSYSSQVVWVKWHTPSLSLIHIFLLQLVMAHTLVTPIIS